MKILAAMSGGVDSSVAAALLIEQGHEVVGVTLKLWGGASDSGCCSVADVEDARRVAQQLGIDHWVLNFVDEFEAAVVTPYAEAHAAGRTPNPCIECNRHFKFGHLLERARKLGFDAVATGHHARVALTPSGRHRLRRGTDRAKDQSYVLHMLTQAELSRCLFPVGEITKAEVRARAMALGLRTADKAESQDVCFVTASDGRKAFLEPRIALHAGSVVDRAGVTVGRVEAVELVTVGQRRGLGAGGGADKRFAVSVDTSAATVTVGSLDDLLTDTVELGQMSWIDAPLIAPAGVEAQCSAHGRPVAARYEGDIVRFAERQRRVAPGQSVVLFDGNDVIGGGTAIEADRSRR
ncbi:MAG TPA: tRNA 2-thiouridine(34) synthase MnmA [Acidimicrobiales bacterium]|nr:tRNA 2-thiouridine(34) synthase MnmA [Acidimicrobiales bacterium]